MEKKDFLETWGHLQTLKDILEQKARDVAARGGDDNALIAGRYLKQCSEIRAMQEKIDKEVEGLP